MGSSDEQPYPRPSKVPEDAKCWECGYSLRGLVENVCPECGSPFDPNRSLSYEVPSRTSDEVRSGKPPGLFHILICAGATIILLSDFSIPGTSQSFWLSGGACFAVFLLAVDWMLRLITRRRLLVQPLKYDRRNWIWIPLLVAILLSSFWYPWPAYVRFQLSKHDFEQLVTDPALLPSTTPQMIGAYRVRAVRCEDDGCVYLDVGVDVYNRRTAGFWFVPSGSPSSKRSRYLHHKLDENWYIGFKGFQR